MYTAKRVCRVSHLLLPMNWTQHQDQQEETHTQLFTHGANLLARGRINHINAISSDSLTHTHKCTTQPVIYTHCTMHTYKQMLTYYTEKNKHMRHSILRCKSHRKRETKCFRGMLLSLGHCSGLIQCSRHTWFIPVAQLRMPVARSHNIDFSYAAVPQTNRNISVFSCRAST